MVFYYCSKCRIVFETIKKEASCPVSGDPLISFGNIKILQHFKNICPITFEDLDEGDPEILVFNPESLLFSKKKIKARIPLPQNNGNITIDDKTVVSFLSLSIFQKLKKQYGKPIYVLNNDGSFHEKT